MTRESTNKLLAMLAGMQVITDYILVSEASCIVSDTTAKNVYRMY